MRYIVVLLSLVFFGLSALSQGQVTIYSKDRGDFYFHNQIAFGTPVTLKSGSNSIEIPDTILLFEANEQQIPYLIYPGEKIERINQGNISTLSVPNKRRTFELNFFRTLIERTGLIYDYGSRMGHPIKAKSAAGLTALEEAVENNKLKRKNLLDSFSKAYDFTKEFVNIASGVISSTAASEKLLLFKDNMNLYTKAEYDRKVKAVLNELSQQPYSSLFPYLRAVRLSLNVRFGNYQDFVLRNEDDLVSKLKDIDTIYKGRMKEFLIAHALFTALKFNLNFSPTVLSSYRARIGNKVLDNYIDEIIAVKNSKLDVALKDKFISPDGKVSTLQSILHGNKGKLIYIDIWASWCTPCRNEFPYSAALIKKFKGKEVAFLFFSIDQSQKDWKRAMAEDGLTANSYFIHDYQNSAFTKKYGINKIPRYFLIDSTGNIISDNAQRPSSADLVKIIDRYLGK